MSSKQTKLIWPILLIMILYILQGVILGFTQSISYYLASYKASWKEQGTFSWVFYPFSFKILWAPIMDSIYSRRFGHYQTWLIPIQLNIGLILIILSFYLESLLINRHTVILTIIFFVIYFLIASQDIVVDGWSISLFTNSNPQWSSTCQTMGEIIGRFIGTTILLTLESAHFTNKYIRTLLSLPHRSDGLFSLQQFTRFWGIAFIVVTMIIMLISLYTKQLNGENMKKDIQTKLVLSETYLAIFKLLRKRYVRQFAFVLLTFNVGFAATYYMTNLTLLGYDITRDTLALINIPLLLIQILVPLSMSGIRCPFLWFARGYIPRLFGSLLLAIYIFFTPQIRHTTYFYPLLIILLCINEGFVYIITVSRIGAQARISEARIAATYMTLLATLSMMGQSLSSTIVLYIANWLPKSYAYLLEVGICFILGFIWIGLVWRITKRFNELPVEEWHLQPSSTTS